MLEIAEQPLPLKSFVNLSSNNDRSSLLVLNVSSPRRSNCALGPEGTKTQSKQTTVLVF